MLSMRKQRARNEADDGDRTRDPQLGKLMLYRLSYIRSTLSKYTMRDLLSR